MDSPTYSYFHHHHNCRNKDNYKGRNENKSTAAVVCKSGMCSVSVVLYSNCDRITVPTPVGWLCERGPQYNPQPESPDLMTQDRSLAYFFYGMAKLSQSMSMVYFNQCTPMVLNDGTSWEG